MAKHPVALPRVPTPPNHDRPHHRHPPRQSLTANHPATAHRRSRPQPRRHHHRCVARLGPVEHRHLARPLQLRRPHGQPARLPLHHPMGACVHDSTNTRVRPGPRRLTSSPTVDLSRVTVRTRLAVLARGRELVATGSISTHIREGTARELRRRWRHAGVRRATAPRSQCPWSEYRC